MKIKGQPVFQFNPFAIKDQPNSFIKTEYERILSFMTNGDTPYEIAFDIDCYANMGYLLGEMIARYYVDTSNYEAQLKVDSSNQLVAERNQWMREHKDEKIPAISYFDSKVTSMLMDRYKTLNEMEGNLKRFKFAYDSLQDKQNALKKSLDAVKFDVLNR